MPKANLLKIAFLSFTLFITLLLAGAFTSLFFVIPLAKIWECISSKEMMFSLKLSLWTSCLSTLLVILFALPIGYTMSRFNFWGQRLVRTIMDLPIAFPELVLGLCLMLLFGNTPLADLLSMFDIDLVFTTKSIIVAQFFTALPYSIRILHSTYDYINPRYELISRSLGYTPLETFIYISIPMAKTGIIGAIIIAFARCIGAFGSVLILAGGTYMKTEVLPVSLYLNISYGNMDMAVSSGVVMVIVSFLAIFVFEKTKVEF